MLTPAHRTLLALMMLAPLALAPGCDDPERDNPSAPVNRQLLVTMSRYYLWAHTMPRDVRFASYPSASHLLEALRNRELDRWSHITTHQQLAQYQHGVLNGFGFGAGFDAQGSMWITHVYSQSALQPHGVTRGWRITAVNGTPPTPANAESLLGDPASVTLTLAPPQGASITLAVSRGMVPVNSVLGDTVFYHNGRALAYINVQDFNGHTVAELNPLFDGYKAQGVDELIVDLRHNQSRRTDVARHLASLIAGYRANGGVFAFYTHSLAVDTLDRTDFLSLQRNTLPLHRVAFITSHATASAAEALINGLKPHLEVITVGQTSLGMPVGLYSFSSPALFDEAFVLVCYAISNARGQGEYFAGIPPQHAAADGIAYPYGDPRDPSLHAALTLLGGTPPPPGQGVALSDFSTW